MSYRINGFLMLLVIFTFQSFTSVVNATFPKEIVRNTSNNTTHPEVFAEIDGLTAVLDNGIINITFGSHATVSSLYKNNRNIVQNADPHNFRLDWYNGTFKQFSPTSLKVISKSSDHAHIMYLQDSPGFLTLEYHIIIQQGLSGLYTYVKATNNEDHFVKFSEMRLIYQMDTKATNQITNSVQKGTIPDATELTNDRLVQDTTWIVPSDATIYTKYDYAGYLRNTSYTGVFGDGKGAWLISASREYHSGGPLKQDLLVQHDSLIANYMTGSHFSTPDVKAPSGWSKIYGPWLLYFNQGTDDEMERDVIRQTKVEQSRWPYQWMDEPDYPLNRGELRGQVISPVRSMVVLSSSLTEDFELQTLGFSYSTESNGNGDFELKNIRPGIYKLTAYPIEGFGIGAQSEKLVNISEGINRETLKLSVPTEVKWSIGETNRRSDSYRYSNERRNYIWHLLPAENLVFEIGKSDIHSDWYYAQTKQGNWRIKYKDSPNGKNRILRIGIAGASDTVPSPDDRPKFAKITVTLNDHLLSTFQYDNDKSIYRSAQQSGAFHAETVIIPKDLVEEGDNIISLRLHHGYIMYDSINMSDEEC